MSNELPLLASAYYSLFCTFHDWYEAALGEQEPPGLVMRPVRSADEEWPHGALLPAVICLLRSRRARIERVRSMRRRHMLYTSHGTMLPCSSSHLSCLAQGRRSLAEWGFYCRLAHGVLLEATTELERARLVHGLREWQRTAKFITAREAYVTIWGVLSLPRRLFQWWSLCAAMNARKEGQALSYALSWASSAGPRVVVAVAFRVLKESARTRRAVRRAAGALVHRATSQGWRSWLGAIATDKELRLAYKRALGEGGSANRRRRLSAALVAWRGRYSLNGARALRAARHFVLLAAARLRRGWWVWQATVHVNASLQQLMWQALFSIGARRAFVRWRATDAFLSACQTLAAAAHASLDGRYARRFVWCFRHWKAERLILRERRRTLRAVVTQWQHPAMGRALSAWWAIVGPRRAGERAARTLRRLAEGRAWRTWLGDVALFRAYARLRHLGASYLGGCVAKRLRSALRLWRRRCTVDSSRGQWEQLIRTGSAHNWRGCALQGWHAFKAVAVRARARSDLLRRAFQSRERKALRRALLGWRWNLRLARGGQRLASTALSVWAGRGVRSSCWRALQTWRALVAWRLGLLRATIHWRYPALTTAFERLMVTWKLGRTERAATRYVRDMRRRAAIDEWHACRLASMMDASILQHAVSRFRFCGKHRALATWQERTREAHELALDLRLAVLRNSTLRRYLYRIRRFARLGKVLERIATESRLDCWRRYVAHDLVLMARAVDGLPGMSRRRHLRHWHIVTVATLAHLGTATRAVARWRLRHVGIALSSWAQISESARAAHTAMQRVQQRWVRRSEVAVVRNWASQCQAVREALAALRRAIGSWRLGKLAGAWRCWFQFKYERLESAKKMRGALTRLLHQNVSRALECWREDAKARLRAEALVAKLHPTGRQLQRALNTWGAVCAGRARVLSACSDALRHYDARLLRRIVHAWASTASRSEALFASTCMRFLAAGGLRKGWNTWAEVSGSAAARRDAQRAVLFRMRNQALVAGWMALTVAARTAWRLTTSMARWRQQLLNSAWRFWADSFVEQRRSKHERMLLAAHRFAGCMMPTAWASWKEYLNMLAQRRRLVLRAAAHWSGFTLPALWDRWVTRTAERTASGQGWGIRVRRAFVLLREWRLWIRSSRIASLNVFALSLGLCVRRWRAHAAKSRRELALVAAGFSEWRDGVCAHALAFLRVAARANALRRNRYARADSLRLMRALLAWDAYVEARLDLLKVLREAAIRWCGGTIAHALWQWRTAAKIGTVVDLVYRRWVHHERARALSSWVTFAVEAAALRLALMYLLSRDRARGWRSWRAAIEQAAVARATLEDGVHYRSVSARTYAFVRWAQLAARKPKTRRELRLLRAAFVVWREVADDWSDGSDLATGGMARQGGRALIAAGSASTRVVVFGANAFGQLGDGTEREHLRPTVLAGLSALRVCAAACGDYHSAIVTADGELYTFGIGEYGVLGHGNDERCARPRRVDALAGEAVTSAACGWRHTACLTAAGRLYTWGHGGYGQLGHGGNIHFALPLLLQPTHTHGRAAGMGGGHGHGMGSVGMGGVGMGGGTGGAWALVSCGWRHTAALAEGGVAFSWGDGEHLQLGHGTRETEPRPRLIETLAADALRQLECGSHHMAAVSSTGRLYTWGSGSFGQLGHGERRAEPLPRLVVSLASIEVVRIACGGHTCVLGAQGELFTFGNGKHGQLGHGERRAEASPRRVQALRHARVLGIACGDFHTLALADDGHVYTWGAGAFGELGHGDLAHVSEPCRLKALRRHELVFAACGASHNIVLLDDEGALGPSDGSDDEDERYGTRSGYEEDRHSSA